MKISVGSDEHLRIVDVILQTLIESGHEVKRYIPGADETLRWPQVARQVAQDITAGSSDEGILLCWTGTGVSMAANKVPGIRAALCDDAETARGARLWNNANVLCLSMRRTSEVIVKEILETWFNTQYEPNPTDDACLALIEELDDARLAQKS